MATYKVWLTVKDSYGKTKEIDGGTINVDLATLTPDELDQIEEALPLEDYLKKENIDAELASFATDQEMADKNTMRYSDFELYDDSVKTGGNQ